MNVRNFLIAMVLVACTPLFAAGDAHGFNWIEFIAKVINTTIFFGVLIYFFKNPVKDFFTNRLKKIKESLALAEHSREEAKQRLDEIEEKMKHLDQELADYEQQAREEVEAEKERIHLRAKEESERILKQAEAQIENMKREAIIELKAFAAEKALDEAERMLEKDMTATQRRAVFKDFVDKMEAQL